MSVLLGLGASTKSCHWCLLLLVWRIGFACRWELTPDQSDVLLSVDYRGLLPDESITLELAPNNIVRLTPPADEGPGAVFQASVWVEHSILVSFQTTRTSTSKGERPKGGQAGTGQGPCQPAVMPCHCLPGQPEQTAVVVLACVLSQPCWHCDTRMWAAVLQCFCLLLTVLPWSIAVGAFSISWTSVSSGNKSILDGKMMIVVLSCVSAAGAVLAACCFYFVCCGRRRRAGVSQTLAWL